MAPIEDRVKQEQLRKRRIKQEQLRKRRNNLLRRHNDFWSLYSIKSWVVMEMPNGRLYTYYSHPNVPVPTKQEIVRVGLFTIWFIWKPNFYRVNVLSQQSTSLRQTMTPVPQRVESYQTCQQSLLSGAAVNYGVLCRIM